MKKTFFSHDKNFYAALFPLLIIISLQNLISYSVNMADNIMLGAYSQNALSGAALVNQVFFLIQQAAVVIGDGLVVIASQYWGQNRIEPIRQITGMVLKIALGLGIFLIILCSGINVPYGQTAGAELTIQGFTTTYGGWVSIFTAIALCCFAFSTTIGWGLYGSRCIEFLFGTKTIRPFMIVYSLVAILGATVDLGLLWSIAETFNGLMSIPNLIAVFLLSGTVVKLTKEYFGAKKS